MLWCSGPGDLCDRILVFTLNFHLIFMGAKSRDGCCLSILGAVVSLPGKFGHLSCCQDPPDMDRCIYVEQTKNVTWSKKPITIGERKGDKQIAGIKSAIVAAWQLNAIRKCPVLRGQDRSPKWEAAKLNSTQLEDREGERALAEETAYICPNLNPYLEWKLILTQFQLKIASLSPVLMWLQHA